MKRPADKARFLMKLTAVDALPPAERVAEENPYRIGRTGDVWACRRRATVALHFAIGAAELAAYVRVSGDSDYDHAKVHADEARAGNMLVVCMKQWAACIPTSTKTEAGYFRSALRKCSGAFFQAATAPTWQREKQVIASLAGLQGGT